MYPVNKLLFCVVYAMNLNKQNKAGTFQCIFVSLNRLVCMDVCVCAIGNHPEPHVLETSGCKIISLKLQNKDLFFGISKLFWGVF